VGSEGSLPQTTITGLLERGDEIAAVDAAIDAAKNGAGRFVVIEGPAGIGKTSILVEGRTRAVASGLNVLQARGSELETAFSFGVVRQLFEAPLARRSTDERNAVLGGAAAQAARLFTDGTNAEPAQDDPFSLLHGLYWLTANLSEAQPLLLAIDDIQWSDGPSLRWLAYLSRRLEGMPVVVVASLRPISAEQPQLDELLLDSAVVTIRPNALSTSSVAELVRVELGDDAEDEFVTACHGATGGNPLLLRELLRSLAAEDVAPAAAAVGVVERLAPDAVTRSVRVRLGRLPAEAAQLARAVAVLGDRADRERAAVVADIDRRQVAPAAAALASIDLLNPEPPFSFVHPLVRNAVYEGIPLPEREAGHARAAKVLTELGATPEQIAAQILVAPPASVENATPVLREAARAASAEGGLESAASYLQRALDEPLTGDERGELLLELAGYEANIGAPAVIPHLREALASLSDPERQAEAALALGHELYWSGDEKQGVEVLERALAELPNLGIELRTRLEAELVVNATRVASQYERAREVLAGLDDISLDDGSGARVLLAGRAYHAAASGEGDADRAADAARAALEAMSHEERAQNYTGGAYTLLRTDRLEEGIRVLDSTLADVRRRGAVFHFSSLSITRAVFNYARGALNEAEADGRAALETLPHRNVWFAASVHGWLAQILVERGNIDEAVALIDAIEPTVAAEAFARATVVRGWTLVDAARGDHRAALAHAHELGAVLTSFGHTNPAASYPAWRSLAALEHHALGEIPEALALAREEVELARDWGVASTLGRALRINGLVESGDRGIELMRESVSVLASSPARLDHAYALADLGSALRRANHRADAREPLRQALDFAQRSGAVPLAAQAHEELIAAGARPRSVVRSGAASLTPSERRIAAMTAEGLSNREIAQALFVTLRTVEMHLSNVFRKLQISSRTQVAAALAADVPDLVGASDS